MNRTVLARIARAMVRPGRGLLAADESTGTIKKRFDKIGAESTEENRRAYRELLFTAPGIAESISGVILYDETLRQATRSGERFADLLSRQGIVPGIKVDAGTKSLPNFPGELVTDGLDGLAARLAEYHKLGAGFAKWRAVIDIGAGIPTRTCIESNADLLARYAALCQEAAIVPIVEPEVLMDGEHTIERCEEVTDAVLAEVFARLEAHRVYLEGIVLKPNMVVAGAKCPARASPEQVAEATLHLDLINRAGAQPWALSFSYGRALQASALRVWQGAAANVAAAQREFAKRARLNSLATAGQYDPSLEKQAA